MSLDRCDILGCPRPDEHFPVAQLVLPLTLHLAVDVMQAAAQACERHGLKAVFVDLPEHGNGRLYASKADDV